VVVFTNILFIFVPKFFKMQRPNSNEHAPYFSTYIDLVGDDNFFDYLDSTLEDCIQLFKQIPEDKEEYRYAEGKWTPKEMLMHIIDTERIFCYRALTIARNDKTPLPGFDENAYAANIDVSDRTIGDLLAEFKTVREATSFFLQYLPDEKMVSVGLANNFLTSTRAIAFMIVGHTIHHCNILKTRYL
jgi:uncharacterized damage-inducible protein DinB